MTGRAAGTLAAVGMAFAGVLASVPAPARADNGWAVDRFLPAPAGDLFFAADRPWYGDGHGVAVRGALVLDIADRPLILPPPGLPTADVLTGMAVGHLQATIAWRRRLDLAVSLPLSFWQSGRALQGVPLAPASGIQVGDLRLLARVRLLGDAERDAISLHAAAELDAAAGGTRGSNMSDAGLGGRFYGVAAGRIARLSWSVLAGLRARPAFTEPVTGTRIGTEAFFAAGTAWALQGGRLLVGPEAFGAEPLVRQGGPMDLEAIAGAHYRVSDRWLLGLGVAAGLADGVGTPPLRVLVQITYAGHATGRPPLPPPGVPSTAPARATAGVPSSAGASSPPSGIHLAPQSAPVPASAAGGRAPCPGDRDCDGVPDPKDQCPDVPAGPIPDPLRPGCPLDVQLAPP